MTAAPRQRDRSSWGRTAIRRMIGTLRHVNEELLHAHEAMARPVGAPQPRPRVDTADTGASVPTRGASVPPHRPASAAERGKPAA
jgi:hypothetical protein